MQIVLQTIDGQFHQSDFFDADLNSMTVTEVAEFRESLKGVMSNWRNMDYLSLEVGEVTRYFNPVNILWAEIRE